MRPLPVEKSIKLSKGVYFEIELSEKEMVKIIAMPVFHGLSWENAFHTELVACKKEIEQRLPNLQSLPKLVFLTGGASRMRFLGRICKDVFPDAQIQVRAEPQLTIAKGLALVGRTDFKIEAFRVDVEKFIDSTILREIVTNEVPALCQALCGRLIVKVIEISNTNFSAWAMGRICTVEDVEKKIAFDIEQFIKNSSDHYFHAEIASWFDAINESIENKVYQLCDKYGIPRTALRIGQLGTTIPGSVSKVEPGKAVGDSISNMIGLITGVIMGALSIALTIASGPWGILFLAITSPIMSIFLGVEARDSSKKCVEKKFKKWNIPVALRENLFSEEDIRSRVEAAKSDIEQNIKTNFEKQILHEENLHKIIEPINEALNKSADRAALIIKCTALKA